MIHKIFFAIQFFILYLFQLLKSNIYLARLTLSPKLNIKYGFIEIPLTLKSNFGILLYSNLVSMTPGSLVTNINTSRTIATIHVIYSSDENDIYKELQNMQNKIKTFTD